jgi:hypothetical protein
MSSRKGSEFLNKKYGKSLSQSREVFKEQKRRKEEKKGKEKFEIDRESRVERIEAWMKVLERTHRNNPKVKERLKKYYHKEYVIKPENVPESYFKDLKERSRERGENIQITPELKEIEIERIIEDQKSSLDDWFEYLIQRKYVPVWVKYWVFNSATKLSKFDKEKKEFGHRNKETVAPFPSLNPEPLALVIDYIQGRYGEKYNQLEDKIKEIKQEIERITEDLEYEKIMLDTGEGDKEKIKGLRKRKTEKEIELNQLIEKQKQIIGVSDNFSKESLEKESFNSLYSEAYLASIPREEKELQITKGEWVEFEQGSDHKELVSSLEGMGTGWCIAGEKTAENYISAGDFHIYYSHDEKEKPRIPRIAIHMDGSEEISEIRGIAEDQNLDSVIAETNILDNKLQEFGSEGEKYKKKDKDMKTLTKIEKRVKKGFNLSKEELRFLYEIDDEIECFGWQDDPRIEEIREKRDMREDLAFIFECSKEEISLNKEEALSGGIRLHYGDLNLRKVKSAKGLELPKEIIGRLCLGFLKSAEGLKLPEKVESLELSSLESAEGLKLPEKAEIIRLNSLKSAEGLELPENLININLSSLESAEGLKLPGKVESLDLNSLKSIEGLELPEKIKSLDLSSLKSAKEGLELPEKMEEVFLSSLESAEGLKLPKELGSVFLDDYGYTVLDIGSLTSIKNLKLPEKVLGTIVLNKKIKDKVKKPEGARLKII